MKVLLDCNIWDQLANDGRARARLAHLVDSERLVVVVPATLRRELEASPFGGIPDWFSIVPILDGVAVVGHSRVGECRLGDAEVFRAHRGESRQVPDAVLADTAHAYADVFVSEDRRARDCYARIAGSSRALDFSGFRTLVLELEASSSGESA